MVLMKLEKCCMKIIFHMCRPVRNPILETWQTNCGTNAAQSQDWNATDDTAAIYNYEYSELFVCHKQSNDKTYLLSNAMVPCRSSRSKAGDIFGWDLYAANFKHNDDFNRNLHHKSWFHRVGGNHRAGEEGHIDDYALAVTLQNTFNVFKRLSTPISQT